MLPYPPKICVAKNDLVSFNRHNHFFMIPRVSRVFHQHRERSLSPRPAQSLAPRMQSACASVTLTIPETNNQLKAVFNLKNSSQKNVTLNSVNKPQQTEKTSLSVPEVNGNVETVHYVNDTSTQLKIKSVSEEMVTQSVRRKRSSIFFSENARKRNRITCDSFISTGNESTTTCMSDDMEIDGPALG